MYLAEITTVTYWFVRCLEIQFRYIFTKLFEGEKCQITYHIYRMLVCFSYLKKIGYYAITMLSTSVCL
jgi:hypothetical protein